MKTLLLLAILSLTTLAFSNELSDELECDTMIAYRPGGSSLMEARFSFATELEILLNSCEVQKLVKADNSNFYIRSYDRKDSSKEVLKYEKVVFEDGKKPQELQCTLVKTSVFTNHPQTPGIPSIGMGSFDETYKNECVDQSNPEQFTCQKGWINCMPIVSEDKVKYCSNDYAVWHKANCGGGEPNIAH